MTAYHQRLQAGHYTPKKPKHYEAEETIYEAGKPALAALAAIQEAAAEEFQPKPPSKAKGKRKK